MQSATSRAMPLRAWSDAERRRLAAAVDALVREWALSWGLDAGCVPAAACRDATLLDLEPPRWSAWRARAGARLWWLVPEEGRSWLQSRLFPDAPCAGSLAARVPGAALDNLQERLLAWTGAAPQPDGRAPGEADLAPWSGAVLVGWPVASLLLSGDWVAGWCAGTHPAGETGRPPAAPQSLRQVLADQPLRLQVRLAGARLPLGDLAHWRIGQVVPLEHRLDQPAQLTDTEGRVWHLAWLVDLEGRRAVELASAPHVPSNEEETP